MKHLRLLTNNLPIPPCFDELVIDRCTHIEIEATKGGPILLFGIYKNDKIAVCKSFAPAGTEMALHTHPEIETTIVYEGCIEISYEDGSVYTIKPGEVHVIKPNEAHKGRWLENSWAICTTIPPAKGFPDV